MEKFNLNFLVKTDGRCPVIDFLDSLDLKMRAKTLRMIMLLEQNGNDLKEPYSKFLGDGIYELRVKQGTNIVRILYFFMVGRRIIVTNGFVKKTQKLLEMKLNWRRDIGGNICVGRRSIHE